jgi:hypothetical protein
MWHLTGYIPHRWWVWTHKGSCNKKCQGKCKTWIKYTVSHQNIFMQCSVTEGPLYYCPQAKHDRLVKWFSLVGICM